MNQQKIQPDYQQMSATLDEVIGGTKQDSLQPIIKIFMESLESYDYREHEILNSIADYFHKKDSQKYTYVITGLEKTVKEAQKINDKATQTS